MKEKLIQIGRNVAATNSQLDCTLAPSMRRWLTIELAQSQENNGSSFNVSTAGRKAKVIFQFIDVFTECNLQYNVVSIKVPMHRKNEDEQGVRK